MSNHSTFSRRTLLNAGAALLLPGVAAAQGGAKQYAGVTLNVSTFSAAYPTLLNRMLKYLSTAARS